MPTVQKFQILNTTTVAVFILLLLCTDFSSLTLLIAALLCLTVWINWYKLPSIETSLILAGISMAGIFFLANL